MAERRIRYADHRPYVVAETLDELVGPTAGLVTRDFGWITMVNALGDTSGGRPAGMGGPS